MKKKSFIEEDDYISIDPNMIVTAKPSARKIARAKATFEMIALVEKNRRKQQPKLTALQTELLFQYNQEPSEKQQKQFDVFRFYLFADDKYSLEPKLKDSQPKKKLAIKRDQLAPFQAQLLRLYDREPTEEQMLKLKDFLYKLFNNLLNKFDPEPVAEMAA